MQSPRTVLRPVYRSPCPWLIQPWVQLVFHNFFTMVVAMSVMVMSYILHDLLTTGPDASVNKSYLFLFDSFAMFVEFLCATVTVFRMLYFKAELEYYLAMRRYDNYSKVYPTNFVVYYWTVIQAVLFRNDVTFMLPAGVCKPEKNTISTSGLYTLPAFLRQSVQFHHFLDAMDMDRKYLLDVALIDKNLVQHV